MSKACIADYLICDQSCYAAKGKVDMQESIRVLDIVALTEDFPDRGLKRGQVGTVVEELAPQVFEVEFSDDKGRTYASLSVRSDQLLMLHYKPDQLSRVA